MNPQRTFARKVIYAVAIGLLLIPLFLLARPTSKDRPGGKLSQLRSEQGLSEANLGEIDPAGEAMKLSTFGMRGVATALLFSKSTECKKRKDWTKLAATLNQIVRLEPHFISVWKYQAWELAYNVSAEFDDYRERYRWVIKGIDFLIEGTQYNERNPRLQAEVGWDIAQKIGTADEKVEFRVMFKEDEEFHTRYKTPSLEDRDNWLVGKSWYVKAEELVGQGESLDGMGENVFYARRPMCQMNFARNIESDGTYFGERAQSYWAQAHSEWTEDFGARPIRTTHRTEDGELIKIILNDFDRLSAEADQLTRELEAFNPGLRKELFLNRWERLDPQDRDAWRFAMARKFGLPEVPRQIEWLNEVDPNWLSDDVELVRPIITSQQAAALAKPVALHNQREADLVGQAERTIGDAALGVDEALKINLEDVARQLEGADRKTAFQLVQKIEEIERRRNIIRSYRHTINYDEWEFRSRYEQLDETLTAREEIFLGQQELALAHPEAAREHFQKGLTAWGALLDREDCQRLVDDRDTADDLKEIIKSYMELLGQESELFAEDFPLGDFYTRLATNDPQGGVQAAREAIEFAEAAAADGDPAEAADAYESAMKAWGRALYDFPALKLMASHEIGGEMLASIEGYSSALATQGKPMPADFVLARFLSLVVNHAPETEEARHMMTPMKSHLNNSEFGEAQDQLDKIIANWRVVLDRFPSLMSGSEAAIAEEIDAVVEQYRKVLDLRGKEMPEDFPLQDFIDSRQPAA